MKNECSIVKDLLPLYADEMLRAETAAFVKEHLESCKDCAGEYKGIKEPELLTLPEETECDVTPLTKIKRRLTAQKRKAVLLAVVFTLTVWTALFAIFSAPEFYPYSDELLQVTENADGSATVTFDEAVTDHDCSSCVEEETGTVCYFIDAWSSPWDRWFSSRGTQSVTIRPEGNAPVVVYYSQNNGEEDVPVYRSDGNALADTGVVTLPRMVLGAYFAMALVLLVLLGIAFFVFRRKETVRVWIGRAMPLPVSYLLGHLIVKGFDSVSYAPVRDFTLIVAAAALIFCALLLLHSILYQRRAVKN